MLAASNTVENLLIRQQYLAITLYKYLTINFWPNVNCTIFVHRRHRRRCVQRIIRQNTTNFALSNFNRSIQSLHRKRKKNGMNDVKFNSINRRIETSYSLSQNLIGNLLNFRFGLIVWLLMIVCICETTTTTQAALQTTRNML